MQPGRVTQPSLTVKSSMNWGGGKLSLISVSVSPPLPFCPVPIPLVSLRSWCYSVILSYSSSLPVVILSCSSLPPILSLFLESPSDPIALMAHRVRGELQVLRRGAKAQTSVGCQ